MSTPGQPSADESNPWGGGRLVVIGGFAKAGSSALFETLAASASVCPSIEKEPYFFVDHDNPGYQSIVRTTSLATDGLDAYRSVFRADALHRPVKVDGSGNYIYQRTALATIPTLPDALVVVTVRRPALRVVSMFRWMRDQIGLLDPSIDFVRFVADARAGRHTGPTASVLNGAIDHSRYSMHLEPWVTAMPGRILVVRTDGTPEELADDLRTLGSRAGIADLPDAMARTNVSHTSRSHALARAAFHLGTSRNWRFKNAAPYVAARNLYRRLNSSNERRGLSPAEADQVVRLDEELADETDRLAACIGAECSTWRRPLHADELR